MQKPVLHTETLTVPAEAIDANGHVNNLVYLHWFVEAAEKHAAKEGWGSDACRQRGTAWVARSHCVEYLHPAYEGERLELTTWIERIERVRAVRRYRLAKSDGSPVAEGESVWVYVDADSLRPRKIPDEMARRFIEEIEEQE